MCSVSGWRTLGAIELEGAPPTTSRRIKTIQRTGGIPVRIGPKGLPDLYVKDLVGGGKLIIPVLWVPHGAPAHTDRAEHTLSVHILHHGDSSVVGAG